MHPNLISFAVPVFFAAIILEAVVARAKKTRAYRLGCAVADLDAGIASQVADAFLKAIGLFLYAALYRYRLVHFEEGSPWPWVVGLVGIDFLYYWWHRTSHVVNLFWAVHAVHHQSEDMNFAVALRQPAFEALTIIPFHLPLALLGVEPWIYVSCYAIDLIYQFWVHTEWTRRRATIEWVLNTPSAHRVHHGINPQYLDKNYGGILLVWDRLFGTYEPEVEPPVYGVTHPLGSYNPIWANFAPFADIGRKMREMPPAKRLGVLFAHPGRVVQTASAEPAPKIDRRSWSKYDPSTRSVSMYVLVHFALLALAGGAFLSFTEKAPLAMAVVPGALILASVLALAAWTEGRPWAMQVDLARQTGVVLLVLAAVSSQATIAIGAAAAVGTAVLFAAIFLVLRPSQPAAVPTPSRG
jgi:sterol desaturase/sphingolipid hydroxylase (fatty acid hydroxylase superfamily)